jgi:hypothetical protein
MEVEPDLKIICDNLVFNKTPEATDDMLERTEYERAYVDAASNACTVDGALVDETHHWPIYKWDRP